MKMIEGDDLLAGTQQKEFNIKKYLLKLLNRWPYILGFFIISLLVGYAINRYSTPVYAVKARITTRKFSDKPSTPVPGLIDANFFLSGLSEVYEEIPTLKSPKRIEAALNKLDYRVSYFTRSLIKKDTESIRGYGFDVEIDTITGSSYPYGLPIYVNHTSGKTFKLRIDDDRWSEVVSKEYRFDTPFQLGDALIRIINTNGKTIEPDKYYFVLNRKAELVNEFSRKLNISWVMKGSAMLDLRIDSESPEKDLKFLQAYYEVVEQMGLEEKNETLDNTISFIDAQMRTVTDSLVYYQEIIDKLKLGNRKLTMGGPEYVYANLNQLEEKKAEVIMNERYLDYLIDYFRTNRDEEVFAPSLLGLNIPLLENWVNQYIGAKLKDKYHFNTENSQNPLVNREDSLRRKLEKGIFESINSTRQMNRERLAELNNQSNTLYGSVRDVQTDFRELSKNERMLQLNQTLFDLFLRRKTEAAISKASTSSDYKIIDAPGYSRNPITPNEETNLLIAAAVGLILPIAFFLIRDITNNKIMDKDDLVSHTQIPILGNVAHSSYSSHLVINEHPRSVVAESFRAVRANLKYLTAENGERCHTFLVTSSVGGEGKTFCSLNLACTLAVAQKRTILIAADLRKPQLANYMDKPTASTGLAEYLAGLSPIEEVIVKGENSAPDFIDAGNIPPNPSELLASDRMKELMGYLKQHYEYIIIDTAPIGLVSDAMELFKYTDYNILIVRQQVTHKAALDMINELYVEGKLRNFTVLFNDIDITNKRSYYGGYLYGMGYSGYGYGYYQEDSKGRKSKRKKTKVS